MTKTQLMSVVQCYMKQVYDYDTQEVYVGKRGIDYAVWSKDTEQIIVVDESAEVKTLHELERDVREVVIQSLAQSMCDDIKYAFKF